MDLLGDDPAYWIGFWTGALLAKAYLFGTFSLLYGLFTGLAARKDRLLIEHFRAEENENATEGVPGLSVDGG